MRRLLALLVLGAAACASPGSRIRRHPEAFDASTPQAQASIRAGRVDVGFTPAQAELAVGRPDRKYARKSAGAEQEVWAYGASSSGLSLGIGIGSFGGGGMFAGGVGLGPDDRREDRARIVFENGAVVSVDRLEK